MPINIIILGTGGNCIDILDTILEINQVSKDEVFRFSGFLDDNPQTWNNTIHEYPVLGPLCEAGKFKDHLLINGIGSTSNFWNKYGIINKTNCPIEQFATVVHPTASVSRFSEIGRGVVILPNVTIASGVKIGNHVIILPGSVISHNSYVGDYCCIASGVCLSGNVRIEDSCYLGSKCVVRNEVLVGKNSLIGMGSVVLRDVPENTVVIGNPARFLRHVH